MPNKNTLPPEWVHFGNMGIIWTNLMDTGYQLPRLYAKWFQKEDFYVFPI